MQGPLALRPGQSSKPEMSGSLSDLHLTEGGLDDGLASGGVDPSLPGLGDTAIELVGPPVGPSSDRRRARLWPCVWRSRPVLAWSAVSGPCAPVGWRQLGSVP